RDLAEEIALAHRREATVATLLGDTGGRPAVEDEVRSRRRIAVLDDPCPGRDFAHDSVLHEGTPLRLGKPGVGRELADQQVEVSGCGGPDRGSSQGWTRSCEACSCRTERRDADSRGDERDA